MVPASLFVEINDATTVVNIKLNPAHMQLSPAHYPAPQPVPVQIHVILTPHPIPTPGTQAVDPTQILVLDLVLDLVLVECLVHV